MSLPGYYSVIDLIHLRHRFWPFLGATPFYLYVIWVELPPHSVPGELVDLPLLLELEGEVLHHEGEVYYVSWEPHRREKTVAPEQT